METRNLMSYGDNKRAKTIQTVRNCSKEEAERENRFIRRLLNDLQKGYIWIRFRDKNGENVEICATLAGYQRWNNQAPGNKYIRLYDLVTGRIYRIKVGEKITRMSSKFIQLAKTKWGEGASRPGQVSMRRASRPRQASMRKGQGDRR